MAIEDGLKIECADLQSTGGIKQILVRAWTDSDVIAFGASGVHTITSIKEDATTDASWGVYEFKNETPLLNVAGTKENGSTAFELGLNFVLPRMEVAKFNQIQSMEGACLMVIAIDTNDQAFVMGVSEKYRNESVAARSQNYAMLSTVEGTTGDAYSSENALTVSLSCKQYELPRIYTASGSGVTIGATGLTATTD